MDQGAIKNMNTIIGKISSTSLRIMKAQLKEFQGTCTIQDAVFNVACA
jgi:hypothetical protein